MKNLEIILALSSFTWCNKGGKDVNEMPRTITSLMCLTHLIRLCNLGNFLLAPCRPKL